MRFAADATPIAPTLRSRTRYRGCFDGQIRTIVLLNREVSEHPILAAHGGEDLPLFVIEKEFQLGSDNHVASADGASYSPDLRQIRYRVARRRILATGRVPWAS